MLKNRFLILFACVLAFPFIGEAQVKSYSHGGLYGKGSGGLNQRVENDYIVGFGYFKNVQNDDAEVNFSTQYENGIFGYIGKTSGAKSSWYLQAMYKKFDKRTMDLGEFNGSSSTFAELEGSELNVALIANRYFIGSNYSTFSLYGFVGFGLGFITNDLEENPYLKVEDAVYGNTPLGLGVHARLFPRVRLFLEYDLALYDSQPELSVGVGFEGTPGYQNYQDPGESTSAAGLKFGLSIIL